MAAAVPTGRGMEAAFVLSSCSDGAAAAIASRANACKQFVGLHSRSSSSSSSCCSLSCFSSSGCISQQTNHGPCSRLQVSHSKLCASSVIRARKRNGRFASRRAPETASKGGKTRENSGGGSVALRDPESASVPAAASSSVNRNLSGALVALRAPEIASAAASSVNSDLIGGLIALRTLETTTVPAVSTSADLNPVDVAASIAAGEVRPTPAEVSEEAIENIFTSGALSATLSSLIRVQEAKLFGPGIFKASKLRVLLLGKHEDERPLQHPRIYTLTHSDLTAMITLAVAREINKAQVMGWYSKLQRDEVVAEWRRTQGEMSLHVHCHISGTNFLHRLIAKLRFYIFQKELPLVLEAFMQGDSALFKQHPELLNAPVWVYFHSNVEDYNRVECWGPLVNAIKLSSVSIQFIDSFDESFRIIIRSFSHSSATPVDTYIRVTDFNELNGVQIQQWGPTESRLMVGGETEQQFSGAAVCLVPCECCSRHETVIPIPESLNRHLQQTQLQQQSKRKGASQSSSFRYLSGPT